jgi:hypothetical protein
LPSTPSSNTQPWPGFLLPSISDLIFLAILIPLTLAPFSTRLLNDAGTGWHLRNGQLILATHTITRADPFSSTMQGRPWYAWEWLYDAKMAAIYNWTGLNGVVFVSALIIAATLALTFKLTLKRGANLCVTLGFLLLTIGASSIHFFARPHIVGWLFTVLWFYILDSSAVSPVGGRRLFWLPVLMLLWANVHGGFLIGFVLLAFYAADSAIQYVTSKNLGQREVAVKRLRRLGLVSALAALASLVNPFGYNLYIHIYQYLSNRFLMDHIDEFLSPNFHGIAQQCFIALLLLTLLVLALARTKPRPAELLIILFAISSGLYAARNLPISSLLLTLVVAPLAGRRLTGEEDVPAWCPRSSLRIVSYARSLVSRMAAMETRLRRHAWPVVVVLLGLGICANGGRLAGKQIVSANFSSQRFPVQACDFIAQRGIPGPIFSPDSWGGYLIYRLYPQGKVVVDDRHDLYGEEFLKRYLKVVHVEPGWEDILKKEGVQRILAPARSSLAGTLDGRPDWSVEYRDDVAVLFRRVS